MTQPNLVMIPSAIKLTSPSNQKVYSILPSNSDGDFFSWWNNYSAIASRYNEDLLVEFGLETRLDWYSRTNCPTLLLESTRTNTFINSNNFNDWTQSGSILVEQNESISPSGVLDAYKLTSSGAADMISLQVFRNTYSITFENYSIFVKRGQNGAAFDPVLLTLRSPSGAYSNIEFDFDGNSLSEFDNNNIFLRESKVRELPNGWLRLEMRFQMDNNYASTFEISPSPNTNVFIWGAQREQTGTLERKVMPSSYIPTTSQQVTRSEDNFVNSGNISLFNNPEGSLFFDIQEIKDDYLTNYGNTQNISLSNRFNSTSNNVNIEFDLDGFTTIRYKTPLGTEQPLGFQIDRRQRNKIVISWNLLRLKIAHNGEIKTNSTHSVGLPSGLDSLSFDDGFGGYPQKKFFGEINDARYYGKLLSNDDLIELSTI
jgi:hypothetical protein